MDQFTQGLHSQESRIHPTQASPTQDPSFEAFLQTLVRQAPEPELGASSGIISRPPALPPGWEDLQDDYIGLHRAHAQFLRKYGVKLPKPGTQKLLSLIYLYRHMGALVPVKDVCAFIERYTPAGAKDKQPRHLKYDGWHIALGGKAGDLLPVAAAYKDATGVYLARPAGARVPNGHLMLVSDSAPSPDFVLGKRSGTIDRSSWEALCTSYGHRCAVCGKGGCVLERGHKDPGKGLDAANLLPMCGHCNNHASQDLVFDDAGRVAAVASERFVATASLATRLRIFDALLNDRAVNINRL